MAGQLKVGREWVEKERERREHKHPDELSYALQGASYVEARERGFIEAYSDGDLRLELRFRAIDNEVCGQVSQDAATTYGFSGLVRPEHSTVLRDELPRELGIECANGKHVVLVAIGERMKMRQGMSRSRLGLHLI